MSKVTDSGCVASLNMSQISKQGVKMNRFLASMNFHSLQSDPVINRFRCQTRKSSLKKKSSDQGHIYSVTDSIFAFIITI